MLGEGDDADKIQSIVITSPGRGYKTNPEVIVNGTATAIAVLGEGSNADQVQLITITDAGSNYESAPTISIAAPTQGINAIATAVLDTGPSRLAALLQLKATSPELFDHDTIRLTQSE